MDCRGGSVGFSGVKGDVSLPVGEDMALVAGE